MSRASSDCASRGRNKIGRGGKDKITKPTSMGVVGGCGGGGGVGVFWGGGGGGGGGALSHGLIFGLKEELDYRGKDMQNEIKGT